MGKLRSLFLTLAVLFAWVMLFDPLWSPSWRWMLVGAFLVTQVALLATSIYFHRAMAHDSLRVSPAADWAFRTILWITTGQRCDEWVAVHRKHHAYTDKAEDPHSPRTLGFWKVMLLNAYYYARAAAVPNIISRFAPDMRAREDAWDRRLFSHTTVGPFGVGMGSLAILFGWRGLAIGLLHAVLYVMVAAPLINAVGHWWGAQTFRNTAYNSRVLAWFTAGESLHNNHHAYPRAPKFSMRRLEFDPSWSVIRVLSAAGLVEVVGNFVRLSKW